MGLAASIHIVDKSLITVSIATLVLLPVVEFIKLIFRRQRPLSLYAKSMKFKSYSFPSGHSYAADLGCGYLLLFASNFLSIELLIVTGVSLCLFSSMIALGRVYLGAHFPSDVVVGILMGVAVAGLIAQLASQ